MKRLAAKSIMKDTELNRMGYLEEFYISLTSGLKYYLRENRYTIFVSRDIYESILFHIEENTNNHDIDNILFRGIKIELNEFSSKTIYFQMPNMNVYLFMDGKPEELHPLKMRAFITAYKSNFYSGILK